MPVLIVLGVVLVFLGVKRYAWRRHGGRRGGHHGRHHVRGGVHWLTWRLGLDATQRDAVRAAAERAREAGLRARDAVHASKAEVADLLRADVLDAGQLDAALAKGRAAMDGVHGALAQALRDVHAVLTPDQRAKAAAMLTRGPRHAC